MRLGLRGAEFYAQTTRVEAARGIGGLESDSMVQNLPQDTIQGIGGEKRHQAKHVRQAAPSPRKGGTLDSEHK